MGPKGFSGEPPENRMMDRGKKTMKYRQLGKTGLQVSEIGLGSEAFVNQGEAFALELIDTAAALGINYFDCYNSEPYVRSYLGKGMEGRREKFIVQGQIGSAWIDGQYQRTRNMDLVKEAWEDLLTRFRTDYIDVGMIHYVDEQKDFDAIFQGPFLTFVLDLKREGKVKHIGLGTHNPKIALQAVKTGFVEVVMLSINPAYDILPSNEDINVMFEKSTYESQSVLARIDPEREALYRLCEEKGVALTVMKPFAGGALLDEGESPFGVAMTVPQCLHYCLTRPAVASVLAGARNVKELKEAAAYCELPEEEKEYATLLSSAPAHRFQDRCMYCGHCAPCTVGIDIATVNKFTDLCEAQGFVPDTVRDHYRVLEAKAGDCVGCGACETRCPFGVKIVEHMAKAKTWFGQ